jgi:hypothetical protein
MNMSEDTKELVEVSSSNLTPEQAERLSAFTRMLNDNKLRIAEIALQVDKLEAEYKRLKGESESQFSTIRGLIAQTEADLKSYTNDLVAAHKINLDEGGWSLSFTEMRFVRHQPKAKAAVGSKVPAKKARK